MPRIITTTYYGPGEEKPIIKVTHGDRHDRALANATYHLSQNHYGAVVVDITGEYGELLAVLTYKIGEKLQVLMEQDVDNPVCVVV